MKYFEVTFSANPCNETITDILSALTAEAGFESFVECEGASLYTTVTFRRRSPKKHNSRFPYSQYRDNIHHNRTGRQGLERRMGEELLPTYCDRRQMCDTQYFPQGLSKG